MKLLTLLIACSFVAIGSPARHFEQNRGQAGINAAEVQFLARDRGRQVFFTDHEVVWASPSGPTPAPAIRLRFPGAVGSAHWQAEGPPVGLISYAIGNDRSKWVKGAGQFERISWRGVYPGVDAVFYWHGERLEYDLVVAPGADPSPIRLAWTGADARLKPDGSIQLADGFLKQLPPVIYQGSQRIAGRFQAVADHFRVVLGSYDRSLPLVIDPVLELATYLGAENDDEVTVVADGLVAGNTASVQFPSAQPERRRSRDVFVRGTGSPGPNLSPVFGTIVFGGSGDDELAGAFYISRPQGVTVAGTTKSLDFPCAATGQQLSGSSDGFLCMFQFDQRFGFSLVSGRLVGGSGDDRINALSNVGGSFVYAGQTTSPDLPNAIGTYSGGIDGFFAHTSYPGPYYLGGKGDDRILAVTINSTNSFSLGGETSSSDFPYLQPGSAGLQGPSDGFLTTVSLAPPNSFSNSDLISSWLVGGSGEDRITALTNSSFGPQFLTIPPEPIAIAGTTTSPDLPVRNASQPSLAGESDAFVGTWRQGTLHWLTYLGGSGADAATGLARNGAGDLFVSGWTRSSDLKTVAPLQDRLGGGEDAFYAVVAPGAVRSLTYFGGTGDDRANSLALITDGVARLGGRTTSTDLPLKNAWQDGRGQGLEGFVVDIGSGFLYSARQVSLAKDGAVAIPAKLAQTAVGVQITYRSSDPTKVLLTDGITIGPEITAPLGREVRAEALVDLGDVEIAISSPGFLSAVCPVKLYPGALITGLSFSSLFTWSQPVQLFSYWGALDPTTNQPLRFTFLDPVSSNPRSGFRLPALNWSSSNESVLRMSTILDGSAQSFAVVVGPGETRLRADAAGLPVWPADGIAATVAKPALTTTTPVIVLGKDLVTNLPYSLNVDSRGQNPARGLLTARSEDPSKLLLSADPAQSGVAAVSLPLSYPGFQAPILWAHALADQGEVRVFLSSPELKEETVVVVRLEPARLRWGLFTFFPTRALQPLVQTQVGSGPFLNFQFESASGTVASGLRPGLSELGWRITNSADSIVETSRITIRPPFENLRLFGLAPGVANITLSPLGPSNIELINPSVRVEVLPSPSSNTVVLPTSVALGKDLQATVQFSYSGMEGAVSAASENPDAVLVASSPSQTGRSSLILSPQINSTSRYSFQLHGLRDSGESVVIVRYPGGEQRIRVTAAPSAIGLLPTFQSTTGFDLGYEFATYYLDDLTGTPLRQQAIMPGKKFEITFRITGAEGQLSRNSATLDDANPFVRIEVTLPPIGQESVLVAEAAGRTVRQILRRDTSRFMSPPSVPLMRDTLNSFTLSRPSPRSGPPPRVTLTSSDPDAVLISLAPAEPGRASVVWPGDSSSLTVFVHGLKDAGTVPVVVEAPGFQTTEILVILSPLRFNWRFDRSSSLNGVSLPVDGSINGAAQLDAPSLRPGVGPIRFTLRTSDPAVATVSPTSFELLNPPRPTDFTLQARRPGSTDLILQREGTSSISAPLASISVQSTTLSPPSVANITLGGNMQATLSIPLSQANPNGVIATVRSSDPSLLVVSRNPSVLGSGSLAVAIQSPSQTGEVFIQALASEGEVLVTASTPGFAEQQWLVRLRPSWFTLQLAAFKGEITVGETTRVSVLLEPSENGRGGTLRPGLGTLRLGIEASNPSLVRLSAPTLAILEGDYSATVNVAGIALGSSLLSLEQPPGFGPTPIGVAQVQLQIVPSKISLDCTERGPFLWLARDSQITCRLGGGPAGTVVQAVSSDPARILLSTNPTALGSGQQTLTMAPESRLIFQALSATGTVEVILSAPGFDDLRVSVVLRHLVVVPNLTSFSISKGTAGTLRLQLVPLDIDRTSLRPTAARAGATIRVGATVSPAGIVSLVSPSVTFGPGAESAEIGLRGDATGTALIQLTNPDGLVDPVRGRVTVVVQ